MKNIAPSLEKKSKSVPSPQAPSPAPQLSKNSQIEKRDPALSNMYINVLYSEKDEAKALGSKWDKQELSGVISTAVTNLSLYRDPIVAKNTSESDFFISDIMNSQPPVDLYLVVSSANLDRLRPLLRVFFNLALRKFTQKMEFENGQAYWVINTGCCSCWTNSPAWASWKSCKRPWRLWPVTA